MREAGLLLILTLACGDAALPPVPVPMTCQELPIATTTSVGSGAWIDTQALTRLSDGTLVVTFARESNDAQLVVDRRTTLHTWVRCDGAWRSVGTIANLVGEPNLKLAAGGPQITLHHETEKVAWTRTWTAAGWADEPFPAHKEAIPIVRGSQLELLRLRDAKSKADECDREIVVAPRGHGTSRVVATVPCYPEVHAVSVATRGDQLAVAYEYCGQTFAGDIYETSGCMTYVATLRPEPVPPTLLAGPDDDVMHMKVAIDESGPIVAMHSGGADAITFRRGKSGYVATPIPRRCESSRAIDLVAFEAEPLRLLWVDNCDGRKLSVATLRNGQWHEGTAKEVTSQFTAIWDGLTPVVAEVDNRPPRVSVSSLVDGAWQTIGSF